MKRVVLRLWRRLAGLFFFALVTLVAGLVPAKAALPTDVLTSEEINGLVNGKTAEVSFVNRKVDGLLYFNPNGVVDQLVGNWREKGVWKVNRNDRLCLRLGGVDWDCRMLIRNKETVGQHIVKKDGNHQLELVYKKFIDGNILLKRADPTSSVLQILNRDEVVTLFINKTVEAATVGKGRESLTYYRPDGTLELLRKGRSHNGTWWVTQQGRMCLKLENLQEKCRIIVKEGDSFSKYIVKKNGQHLQSVKYRRFVPGKGF